MRYTQYTTFIRGENILSERNRKDAATLIFDLGVQGVMNTQ